MKTFDAHHTALTWMGRVEKRPSGQAAMSGSASSLRFRCKGDMCRIWLYQEPINGTYQYITLVIDGEKQPRRPVDATQSVPLEIDLSSNPSGHVIELFKETEAICGNVVIDRIEVEELVSFDESPRKKIEFIGNSITVGMSADASVIPCNQGNWFDQHNATNAYGPRVAREMQMDYLICGVSGMGMYRNWNAGGPVMRDVYEFTGLHPAVNSSRWDFTSFVPDIVSICLGTNDLSEGDGVNPRSPFDCDAFVTAYVDMVKLIHGYYPDAHIVITNTPLAEPASNALLMECLEEVRKACQAEVENLKPVAVFSFSTFYGEGCGGHPSVAQHQQMAEEMTAFLKSEGY